MRVTNSNSFKFHGIEKEREIMINSSLQIIEDAMPLRNLKVVIFENDGLCITERFMN